MLVRCCVRRYACCTSRRGLHWHRAFATSIPVRVETPAQENTSAHSQQPEPLQPEQSLTVLDYLTKRHLQKNLDSQGSSLSAFYNPNDCIDNPPKPEDVTLEMLLAAEAHFGHVTSLWNPANSRYIFGVRSDIHIISLDIIAQSLRRAARVVSGVAEQSGLILFVGNRPGFDRAVVKAAQLAAPACHLSTRWTPGMITNADHLLTKNSMKVLDDLDNEIPGLDHLIHNSKPVSPDLVICLNPIENYALLHECALSRIPTIGIIDTNADPTWVTYPIPANDDSLRCIQLIAGVLGNAARQGQTKRRNAAKKGRRPEIKVNPWFSLPASFKIDEYMQRRERQNPGQLRRDVEAKLSASEIARLANGDDVLSLQGIESRLRREEIHILRHAYDPGFATRSADGKIDTTALFKNPLEEQEQRAKALADVANLAAEASHRAQSLQSSGDQQAADPTADADALVELNGDAWDAPSVVISKNKSLDLTERERDLLAADVVAEAELIELRDKIPPELFKALVEELKAGGKIAPLDALETAYDELEEDDDEDDDDDDDSDDEDDSDDGDAHVRR